MKREILSFVRRNGRITRGQRKHVDLYLEKYSISPREGCNFVDSFGNTNPVVLDIGFGNGEDLFLQSSNHPQYNFVGIEVYLAGIGSLLKKVCVNELANVRIIDNDAVETLNQSIPEGSISRVQLLFPDPWPKKKHQKRRIIQRGFIDDVYKVLGKNGILHIATDCEKYADHISGVIEQFKKFKLYGLTDNCGIHFDREITRFERRGLTKGSLIREFSFIKN